MTTSKQNYAMSNDPRLSGRRSKKPSGATPVGRRRAVRVRAA